MNRTWILGNWKFVFFSATWSRKTNRTNWTGFTLPFNERRFLLSNLICERVEPHLQRLIWAQRFCQTGLTWAERYILCQVGWWLVKDEMRSCQAYRWVKECWFTATIDFVESYHNFKEAEMNTWCFEWHCESEVVSNAGTFSPIVRTSVTEVLEVKNVSVCCFFKELWHSL